MRMILDYWGVSTVSRRASVVSVLVATMVAVTTTVSLPASATGTGANSNLNLTSSRGTPTDSTHLKPVPSSGPVADEPGGAATQENPFNFRAMICSKIRKIRALPPILAEL